MTKPSCLIILFLLIVGFCLYQEDCRKILEKNQAEYCRQEMLQYKEGQERKLVEIKKESEQQPNEQEPKMYWDADAVKTPFAPLNYQPNTYEMLETINRQPYSRAEVFEFSIKRLFGAK